MNRSIVHAALFIFFAWTLSALAQAASDYALGDGDLIKMTVYGHADLTTVSRIGEGGETILPLIGEVKLGGMKLVEAERRVAKLMEERGLINRPQVSIVVEEYRSQLVSVLGMVNKPGQYAIEGRTTLVDMVARAGGVGSEAGYTVNLIRTERGVTKMERLDLTRLLVEGDATVNAILMNGDVIYVPRMDVFYIYGEVQNPGAYRLEPDMAVMQGIALSGGLTARGSERGLSIRRKHAEGGFENADAEPTTRLMPNDVVYVKSSLF